MAPLNHADDLLVFDRDERGDERVVALFQDVILIGRDVESTLRLEHESISRFHARLERSPSGPWLLTDLESSNGTLVNGERIARPRTLVMNDILRFGVLQCRFEPRVDDLGIAEGPLKRRRRRFVVLWATVLGLALAAVALAWFEWNRGGSRAEQKSPDEDRATPVEASPQVELPTVITPWDPTPPSPVVEGPMPDHRDASPPVVAIPEATVIRITLLDGRTIEATSLDRSKVSRFVAMTTLFPRGQVLAPESIASLDGAPFKADLKAIFKERLEEARDLPRMLEVLQFCTKHGLAPEARLAAARVLDSDPENEEASKVLGRHRVLGRFHSREELGKAGHLDAEGRLVGSEAEHRRIRRLHVIVLSRTPTRKEFLGLLALPPEAAIDHLLASRERWSVWLSQRAQMLLQTNAPVTALPIDDLSRALKEKRLAFPAALKALLGSDGIRAALRDASDFVDRTFSTVLEGQTVDPAARAEALKMVAGQRVALFGDRGASRSEFLEIVLRQPGAYSAELQRTAVSVLGRRISQEEERALVLEIAGDPSRMDEIIRAWIVGSALADLAGTERRMDSGTILRSLGQHLQDQKELARWTPFAAAVDQNAALKDLPPFVLAHADGGMRRPAKDTSLNDLFLEVLGRRPTPGESATSRDFLAKHPGRIDLIARALFMHDDAWKY